MISLEKTYQAINSVRISHGAKPLRWDNQLADIALEYAQGVYYKKPRVESHVLIAKAYRSTENLITAWKKKYKKTLVSPFTDIGLAVFENLTVAVFTTK